jgi:hypothetical protein
MRSIAVIHFGCFMPYTHLRSVHEIPARERLADAVPIADLVSMSRKRAGGNGNGKVMGLTRSHLKKLKQERDR